MHPTLCKHFLDKNRVTVWIIRFNSVSCRARLCRHSASSRTRRSRDEYSCIPISLSDTCTGGTDTPDLSNVPWHRTGWLVQQNLVRNRSGKQEMRTEWMLWKTMWQQLDQTQYFQYYMTIRILHATFQLSPGLRWDLDETSSCLYSFFLSSLLSVCISSLSNEFWEEAVLCVMRCTIKGKEIKADWECTQLNIRI